MVVFSAADRNHIPVNIAGLRNFLLDDDYADLLAWLREADQPSPQPNTATPAAIAWPAPNESYRWPLADRKPEFELFRQMLAGRQPKRVLLVKAARNSGKTTLLGGLKEYAKTQGLPVAQVDFKGCPAMEDVFEQLRLGLKKSLPGLAAAAKSSPSFIEGLQELADPLVLLFDTYEAASDESRNWLEQRLLHYIDDMPAVVAVVGGQQIPEHGKCAWRNHAIPHELAAIDRPDDWLEYIRLHWPEAETPDTAAQLRFATQAAGGEVGLINALLERFFGPSALASEYKP